jgi:DNA-binding beta-propeller fold protein YncE
MLKTAVNLANRNRLLRVIAWSAILLPIIARPLPAQEPEKTINLPSGQILLSPVPGRPQPTNSFPTAVALSPDGRYLALLNNGRGTAESGYQQSIAILDLVTNQVSDFPDSRLKLDARQTYFLGLAFASDGRRIYASIASLTDPIGQRPGDTGNGIAVYAFDEGKLSPQRFIKIPVRPLAAHILPSRIFHWTHGGGAVPYPAGLAVIPGLGGPPQGGDKLLVAENLADDAILLDAASGQVLQRFDLTTSDHVPASYPYGVVVTRDGKYAYCSLWNASQVAKLDLERGEVIQRISLLAPESQTAAGSHPTALLLSRNEARLYVALSNSDAVAVIDTAGGTGAGMLSTKFPGQRYGGTYPNALAESADGTRLFVACASLDAVAVFDLTNYSPDKPRAALGFIPTEWYPTALAVRADDLLIASGKGQGTGPNSGFQPPSPPDKRPTHPYIVSLIRGSVARVSTRNAERTLAQSTQEVLESNKSTDGRGEAGTLPFAAGSNPIKHVIYIIKENRTYDQVFGDLKPGDGDPSLCMYGEQITPNEHALARQFGILDNFYDSGEVSGDGHVWSMAAITSDYTEKTWQIAYRGSERTYDYEGSVAEGIPLLQGLPDVNEPGSGYLWANVARHGITHRNYGEFVETRWCDDREEESLPPESAPLAPGMPCAQEFVHQGEALPETVGQPHGSRSPWPWPVPLIARNVATKPELENHFDPRFANFRLDYPDQLRTDEFLNEFAEFTKARQVGLPARGRMGPPEASTLPFDRLMALPSTSLRDGEQSRTVSEVEGQAGKGEELPQLIILRLPNDHTAGTKPGMPRPEAAVADNDLAVGRVVEAVSHSPYWDDTAIFILEDDAQNGADHVDAHRSLALVVSKYSPGSPRQPFVDHRFYTTVNMVRTMEVLLGLEPMNHNDAQAATMAPLFSGPGNQPAFSADWRNQKNGLLYQTNSPHASGAQESARLDFSHADAADAQKLNAILWRAAKGDVPLPAPRHTVIPPKDETE